MKHLHILLFIGLLLAFIFKGQSQMNALNADEIKEAFQNRTRSLTGMPGVNYWQNHAKYVITAEIFPTESLLKGEEQITYFNASPDTLNNLVIRLYQNIYKKGNSRQFNIGPDAVTDGMVIGMLKIDGEDIDIHNRKVVSYTATNMIINLPKPMVNGDSIQLELKWQYKISEERPVRTGNYGGNRFFVAYWYPQIAVYDDVDGWDMIDYLGAVEFYNDFNDFDVTITTPGKFIVWATGSLINEKEIYSKKVMNKLTDAHNSDEVVNIMSVEDCKRNKVLIKDKNYWHYQAHYVPDFSFATTDVANWDGSSLMVDSVSKRKVFVDAVYTDSARTYTNAALWARMSVSFLSNEWPAYPFPYEHITTFSNGKRSGGMESPMMANNGDPTDKADAAATLFHEIAHTYFPFFMGTNERKYAWMDEGWAANLPIEYMNAYFPERKYLERTITAFENINGKEREMSLMTLSNAIGSYDAYRSHAYVRPALAYHFLKDALGDSIYGLALSVYIDRWNGKHPVPNDFFNTFIGVTGQSLGWFFEPWFYNRAVADLGIKKVTLDNKVIIENVGGLPLPVEVNCEFEDGTTTRISETTAVWSFGDTAIILQFETEKRIKHLSLGSALIPDINKENNQMSPSYQ